MLGIRSVDSFTEEKPFERVTEIHTAKSPATFLLRCCFR